MTQPAFSLLSTTGIYLSFVVLLRVVGQRLVSGLGAFDLAAAMAMGALVGRVILGHTPVLAAGVLGLVTLAALQTLVGRFRDTPLGSRLITPAPVLLMADGELLDRVMLEGVRGADRLPDSLFL